MVTYEGIGSACMGKVWMSGKRKRRWLSCMLGERQDIILVCAFYISVLMPWCADWGKRQEPLLVKIEMDIKLFIDSWSQSWQFLVSWHQTRHWMTLTTLEVPHNWCRLQKNQIEKTILLKSLPTFAVWTLLLRFCFLLKLWKLLCEWFKYHFKLFSSSL